MSHPDAFLPNLPRRAVLHAAGLAAAWTMLPLATPGGERITVVRDSYGVPHVYADTREAVSYGAGYALAQDRLWQMHVFRHIARGRLSELFGPSVVELDKTVRFFTYTEAERERRFRTYTEVIKAGLHAFAAGINAWIDEVRADPAKVPFEFTEYGERPIDPWIVTDSVALQDALILAFGAGGGNELTHAAVLRYLVDRYGERRGLDAFDDLIRTSDPDSPPTIPPDYRWQDTPTEARVDEAEAVRALTPDARISLREEPGDGGSGVFDVATGTLGQLALVPEPAKALADSAWLRRGLDALRAMFDFGSNAQIVSPVLSETRNALQTGGPQVGYMVPQWLVDVGLHGGGLDATGMTFAGAGPAVLIGRGHGYAWTTTTGASDLTDTYVEKLRSGHRDQYRYRGGWERMECRTETYTFRGVPFETQEICRTRHGPVMAFDEENGVAYSLRYAWFNREGQTNAGFFGFNEVRSLEDFATYANYLSSNHNMFYSDDQGHCGYWHPGNHPVRADGVDLRLPQDGTGGSEWRGLRPIQDVPHAVDVPRGWMANWNNSPAVGWQRERSYDARDNVLDLFTAYQRVGVADPHGGRVNPDGRWDFEDLSANLRHAAFKNHEETYFRSSLPARSSLPSDLARRALAVVRDWDGFDVDRDGDGRYDSAGSTVLDRWLTVLHRQVFVDDLGEFAGLARRSGELWQVVSPQSTVEYVFDWLGGRSAEAVAGEAFERAAAELAQEFGSDDPSTWRRGARIQRYQRLNADLAGDLARTMACDTAQAAGCPAPLRPTSDSGMPGDIPEHIAMDRGTYNHIVAYLDPPAGGGRKGRTGAARVQTPLGRSAADAGSVIPPGQSGFIDQAGREDRHYQDQLDEYVEWRYKPMPLTFEQAKRQAESVSTITRR